MSRTHRIVANAAILLVVTVTGAVVMEQCGEIITWNWSWL